VSIPLRAGNDVLRQPVRAYLYAVTTGGDPGASSGEFGEVSSPLDPNIGARIMKAIRVCEYGGPSV